jgi:hypothetical protein
MKFTVLLGFAGVLLISGALNAEPARISKNDALRAKPFTNAVVVAQLTKGNTVDIQKREGAWYFVKSGQKSGYVPMLSVQRTSQAPAATAGGLSGVASGRSSTGGIVSTTGVRGLNEEELTKAEFSDSAVAAAERFRIPVAEAVAFSKEAGLVKQTVSPLTVPASKGGRR